MKSQKRLLGILLLILCISCQKFNENRIVANEFGNVDSTFMEQYIPPKIEFKSGISLSVDLEKELLLFEYFNTKYVDFLNDVQFVHEKLYNTNLFNNGHSETFIKHFNKYNDMQAESTSRYIYEQGKIKNIIYGHDNNNSTSFYYDNNKLVEIADDGLSIPFVKTEAHKKTYVPSRKLNWEMKFEYSSNRLISVSKTGTRLTEKEIYYEGKTNKSSEYYLKKVRNPSFLVDGNQEIYGFKAGKIRIHATYNDNEKYPRQFITFSNEGDLITAKLFERISGSSIVEYELRHDYKIQVTGDKKLEQVTNTEINSSKPGYVDDFNYEYIYSGNELIGYKIFHRKYEYSGKNNNNINIDYALDEYFQRVD